MRNMLRGTLILWLAAALVGMPCVAGAQTGVIEPDAAPNPDVRMVADLLVARPIGLIGTVIGGALFVVALPFAALGGNTQEAYEKMVEKPVKYTFQRPLGDID